ncbi:MAG: hypothetical protein AAF557_19065 [Pseudomonadota bacterium]
MARSVLFICTGNIFRSMTAEFALRRELGTGSAIRVSSAGTAHRPELTVREDVADYLLSLGLNVSSHQRRTLSSDILAAHDVIIAMNSDHQQILQERIQRHVPVFFEAATGSPHDMPDVDDLFPPEDHLSAAAREHVKKTIDLIIAETPELARRLRTSAH